MDVYEPDGTSEEWSDDNIQIIANILEESGYDNESDETYIESRVLHEEFKKLPDHVTVRPSLEDLRGFRDYFREERKIVPLFIRWAKNEESANQSIQTFYTIIELMQSYSIKIFKKLLDSDKDEPDVLKFFVPKTLFEDEEIPTAPSAESAVVGVGPDHEMGTIADIYENEELNIIDEDGFYINNPTFRLPFHDLFFQIIQKWHPALDDKYIDIFMINNGYLKDEPIVGMVKSVLKGGAALPEITDETATEAIQKVRVVVISQKTATAAPVAAAAPATGSMYDTIRELITGVADSKSPEQATMPALNRPPPWRPRVIAVERGQPYRPIHMNARNEIAAASRSAGGTRRALTQRQKCPDCGHVARRQKTLKHRRTSKRAGGPRAKVEIVAL